MKTLNFKKLLTLAFPLFVAFILSGCIFGGQQLEEAKALYKSGQKLETQYKYSESLKKYLEANELVPSYADPYLGIARIYNLKGQDKKALEILNSGVEASSDDAELYLELGNIYLAQGEYEDAQKAAESALNTQKTDESYLLLGKVQIHKNKLDDAEKSLGKISKKSENAEETAMLFALLGDSTSDVEGLIDDVSSSSKADLEAYRDAWKKYDSNKENEAFLKTMQGYLWMKNGYPEPAVKVLEPVVKQKLEYFDPRLYLGVAYEALDQDTKAEDVLNEAISLNPTNPTVYQTLGKVKYKKNNIDEYSGLTESAIAYSSGEQKRSIQAEYAANLASKKLYTTSEKVYTDILTALEKTDTSNELKYKLLLAKMLVMKAKGNEKVVTLLESYVKGEIFTNLKGQKQERADLLALLCGAKINLGSRVEGEKYCTQALEIYEFSALAYYFKGFSKYEMDEKEDAEELLRKAVDLDTEGLVSPNAKKMLASL